MDNVNIDLLVQEITNEIMANLGQTASPDYGSHSFCAAEKSDDVGLLLNLGASRIGASLGISGVPKNIASYIDHTALKADLVPADIEQLCSEALQYKFASVCIQPAYVGYAKDLLMDSEVKVCTVIGFPLGANTTAVKAYEAKVAEYDGATEVDMVINIGAVKSGGYDYVENDIAEVVRAVSPETVVKVIIETALLKDDEKVRACELAKRAGADFVKTSTGFSTSGATAGDVALMRKTVGNSMGVKASGGVRDRKTADLMIQSGASRIGASASVQIVKGGNQAGDGY